MIVSCKQVLDASICVDGSSYNILHFLKTDYQITTGVFVEDVVEDQVTDEEGYEWTTNFHFAKISLPNVFAKLYFFLGKDDDGDDKMDQKGASNDEFGDSDGPLKESNSEIFNWGELLVLIDFLPNSNRVCLVVIVNGQGCWQVFCLLKMVFADLVVFWEYLHGKHGHEQSYH